MNKKILFLCFVGAVLALLVFYSFSLILPRVRSSFAESDARSIAEKNCIKGGEALGPGTYNPNSKTWWFDANLNATKAGCNPACVVFEETKTTEINWRCTGALPPDDTAIVGGDRDKHGCIGSAGYSWCASKEKCLRIWEEPCDEKAVTKTCSADERKGDACAEIYAPVCATVQIQCVKAPCNPIKQTFSNSCEACHNPLVSSYEDGKCHPDCSAGCPLLSMPAPGWCDDGTVIDGTPDECGCITHPTCKRN